MRQFANKSAASVSSAKDMKLQSRNLIICDFIISGGGSGQQNNTIPWSLMFMSSRLGVGLMRITQDEEDLSSTPDGMSLLKWKSSGSSDIGGRKTVKSSKWFLLGPKPEFFGSGKSF